MDLAPQALDQAPPPATAPSASSAPAPTPVADLDRAAAELAERAVTFARLPPKEKAALLRGVLPRVLAVAPEMVALACRAGGVDPAGPYAGAAWLSGPVALIAAVRRFAEALEDIAAGGRPELPVEDLRGRMDGRVAARLEARSHAERASRGGAETVAVFTAGVEPEDVIGAQAAFYRQVEPAGGVALVVAGEGPPAAGPLRALDALFGEGKVTVLELSPARSWLGPVLERALGPLCEAGFLRVVQGGEAPGAHLAARLGEPRTTGSRGGPVLVVPAYYAADELWFVARRLASEVAVGEVLGIGAPTEIVLAGCWAQRGLFVETLQRALTAVPWRGAPRTVGAGPAGGAEADGRAIPVLDAGCDDPVEMLAAAVEVCNARSGEAGAVEMVVHVIHEEEAEVAAALDRVAVRVHAGVVGINQWPALAAFRGDATPGPRMLGQVDRTIVRGPLRSWRLPAYFLDNRRGALLGERQAAFEAAPSLGAVLRGARG